MLILNSDGGCNPNPGHATYGFVAKHDGDRVWESSASMGFATNNQAEWRGALAALNYAIGFTIAHKERVVELRMDSLLVVNQLTGRWRTKNIKLKPLQEEGRRLYTALCDQGVEVRIRWVPRAENVEADALT